MGHVVLSRAAVRSHGAPYSLTDSPPRPKVTEDIDLVVPFSTASAAQMYDYEAL